MIHFPGSKSRPSRDREYTFPVHHISSTLQETKYWLETESTYHLPVPSIRRSSFRLILQDTFDLLHDLRRQLRYQSQRFAIILDLLDFRGAQNHRADILIPRYNDNSALAFIHP